MIDREKLNELSQGFKTQLLILGSFVLVFWLLEIADWLLWWDTLDQWGIRPRQVEGLWGVLFAPFLHGGFAHVAMNTAPFLTLGWLVLVRGLWDFIVVTVAAMLVSGFGIWLIAPRYTVHLGASSLVFGYFGYLLLRGYFERSTTALTLTLVVILLYGGFIWGLLPLQVGVSWQGHLFGFIGGGVAAYLLAHPREETADSYDTYDPYDSDPSYWDYE